MFDIFIFICINLLGAMSPGPDFAIVMRYALTGSRRSAYYSVLGISSAIIVHVFYCLFGVAIFIKSSPPLFRTIQVLGAIYLGYLGLRLLLEKKKNATPEQEPKQMRGKNAYFAGFLTNLLNPKATLFLLSLFTEFIVPGTALWKKIAFGVSVPITVLVWFTFLSYMLTHSKIYPRFKRYQKSFTMIMGSILVILSLYVLLGKEFL